MPLDRAEISRAWCVSEGSIGDGCPLPLGPRGSCGKCRRFAEAVAGAAEELGRRLDALEKSAGLPDYSHETLCGVCEAPQFETPHGVTCRNGHGGADAAPEKPMITHSPTKLEAESTLEFERIRSAGERATCLCCSRQAFPNLAYNGFGICLACPPFARSIQVASEETLTHTESQAIEDAGVHAGEYLDSIGIFDLSALSPEQFTQFCTKVLIGYSRSMRARVGDLPPF